MTKAVTEVLTFHNDHTPLDLLLFRRFGKETPKLVEQTLMANPGLAALGAFPPRGTHVVVAPPIPAPKRVLRKVIRLYD